MDILPAIVSVVIFAISLYLIGLLAVWAYELRRSALYRQMQEQVKQLEGFRLSMAVSHARTYRIMENYRRDVLGVERVQQFIFGNLLFINRKSQQNVPICGVISMSAGR